MTMSMILSGMLARLQADADQKSLAAILARATSPEAFAAALAGYNGPVFNQFSRAVAAQTALAPQSEYGADAEMSAFFERIPVYPEIPNRLQSNELPPHISRLLHTPFCPAVDLWCARNRSVFLSYNDFEVLDEREHLSFRPLAARKHSAHILEEPRVTLERPVVLVQDVFHGANYAHFLFDWIGRVITLLQSRVERPRDCLFLLGGFPTEFHRLVLHALAEEYGLSVDNFFFPTGKLLIRCLGPLYVFGDLARPTGHPAQMCRPEIMAPLTRMLDRVETAGPSPDRIYISRSDARRRSIANEAELFTVLERRGFEFIRLADHSATEQIHLFRNAGCVVGAHGMGLTHLAFARRRPVVLELFSPTEGTDAYGFVSKARGFPYHAIAGIPEPDSSDFRIDPTAVDDLLAAHLIQPRPAVPVSGARGSNPVSVEVFKGVQTSPPKPAANRPAPDGVTSDVLVHLRDAPSVTEDTNVMYWKAGGLQAGRVYTAVCWIFIPEDSPATRVELRTSWGTGFDCDMGLRRRWQKAAISRTCPRDSTEIVVVLRVTSAVETSIFSTGFTLVDSPFA